MSLARSSKCDITCVHSLYSAVIIVLSLATLDDINFSISLVYMVTYTAILFENILLKKSPFA